MPNNNLGAAHLADNPLLYEPQRTNNFYFIVNDIDGILRAAPSSYSTNNQTIDNAQSTLFYSVSAVSFPYFSQQAINIARGNSDIKVAGKPSFGDGSLTIRDFIGADGKSVLMAWQALSYDVETEAVGRMANYKKDCTLIEYTPDNTEVVRYYDLKGCWVGSLGNIERSYDGNEAATVQATIYFDKAIMRVPETETLVAGIA